MEVPTLFFYLLSCVCVFSKLTYLSVENVDIKNNITGLTINDREIEEEDKVTYWGALSAHNEIIQAKLIAE